MRKPSSEELIRFVVTTPDSLGGFVDDANLHKALGSIEIRTSTVKEKCDYYIGALVLERMNQLEYRIRVEQGLDRAVDAAISARSARLNDLVQREFEALVKRKVVEVVSAMAINATVEVKS